MNEPIRQGELNGIAWRSLTRKKQMRQFLQKRLKIRFSGIIKRQEVSIFYRLRTRYLNNVKTK